ncbi:UbiA prenyltransferase family-domain-containing protein [Chiua virens]|nr:UbiA prenyltransferase family-domain-containing protein [Chiua virens]
MLKSKTLQELVFWLETIFLFTKSDYKTIFFPVIISSWAASPPPRTSQLVGTAVWVWFHLLQANVSNQTYSAHEDIINKPWRPLPSGRISVRATRRFRWILLVLCLCLSAWHGTGVLISSAALSLVEIVHDDIGFSSDPVLKNLMNVGGYLTFESGATLIMSSKAHFDRTSLIALFASGLLIFTTIHAQDFADAEGDKLSGRRTLPIVAPEGSRRYILAALPLWSIALSALWGLGPLSAVMFLCMGAFVGSQYFRFRDVKHDQASYVLYNVRFDDCTFCIADAVLVSTGMSRYGYWLHTHCL